MMKKLKALIKETGFMQIPKNSFIIKNDVSEYDKFGVKITLNGISSNIQWPEQNATSEFIPPLIVHVKDELDGIIYEIIESYSIKRGTSTLKRGLAHMLKNGVVMDVTTVEQAQIAEDSGAVSVMVLDKLQSDVQKPEGLARKA